VKSGSVSTVVPESRTVVVACPHQVISTGTGIPSSNGSGLGEAYAYVPLPGMEGRSRTDMENCIGTGRTTVARTKGRSVR
jgi:hypothetical protein